MNYKKHASRSTSGKAQRFADGGAVRGVADSGNRGVADLVSDRDAAAQARESAAHRVSKSVFREPFLEANEPMDGARKR